MCLSLLLSGAGRGQAYIMSTQPVKQSSSSSSSSRSSSSSSSLIIHLCLHRMHSGTVLSVGHSCFGSTYGLIHNQCSYKTETRLEILK